ncbi:hypothetical protein, partial [Faecalibaculum rodentium]|uniref:hypothetical protein n=1 Tax=Faecalibaculum rodentium TaxID=1702221 RepID=UPI0023F0D33C
MDLTTEEKGWLEPVHLSCQDPFGNLIVCSVKGHNHLINRHPEMEGCDDEIQSTIENPDKIFLGSLSSFVISFLLHSNTRSATLAL